MTEAVRATAAVATRRPDAGRSAGVPRWRRGLPLVAAAGDLVAVALAVLVALRLRFAGPVPDLRIGDDRFVGYNVAGALVAAGWLVVVALHGGYSPVVVGTGPPEMRRVLRAGLGLFAVLAAAHLLLATDMSARLVVLVVTLTVVFTLASRLVVERVVSHARAHHRWVRRALLLGPESDTRALADRLSHAPALGVEVVGVCLTDDEQAGNGNGDGNGDGDGTSTGEVARLRHERAAVIGMVTATGADVLAVTGEMSGDRVRALAWELEPAGIDLLVAPAAVDLTTPRLAVEPVAGIPLLRVEPCRLTTWRLAAKNAFDRLGAGVLLVVMAPLLVACAVAVRVTSHGPVLYAQVRAGQHGTSFVFLKFRTMVAGAREQEADLADRNESDGLLFKIRDDPRVTPVGRVLRRTSLDELPQLWNVLRGDMSLVGPRPLPVSPSAFVGNARRRLRVKPGLTGLWQVSGRAELSWDETVRIDTHYVDNWSLGMDLLILLRTPLAVMKGTGAY